MCSQKVQNRVLLRVPKKVLTLLKVPKIVPKKVLFAKKVPKRVLKKHSRQLGTYMGAWGHQVSCRRVQVANSSPIWLKDWKRVQRVLGEAAEGGKRMRCLLGGGA